MRRARHLNPETTFYHLITRVAGLLGHYPLQYPEPCARLIELIERYTDVYHAERAAWAILGSHYHLIVRLEAYRELTREELRAKASQLWGSRIAELKTAVWGEAAWRRFNRQLFSLPALMHRLNGDYARWYNRRYGRRGHFWAERYKNVELLDAQAVRDCVLYVETNPVRAGLARRAEGWRASSAWRRYHGESGGLAAIEGLFETATPEAGYAEYREALETYRKKDAQGNPVSKYAYLTQRQRFMTDGIAMARDPKKIEALLQAYREKGLYERRRHPIPQLDGELFTLREQRSHARS